MAYKGVHAQAVQDVNSPAVAWAMVANGVASGIPAPTGTARVAGYWKTHESRIDVAACSVVGASMHATFGRSTPTADTVLARSRLTGTMPLTVPSTMTTCEMKLCVVLWSHLHSARGERRCRGARFFF